MFSVQTVQTVFRSERGLNAPDGRRHPLQAADKVLPQRRGCSDAHEYKRSSRIQEKLTNTEEAHEYRRSSRVQKKLTSTREAHEHSRSPKERAEAPRSEQKPPSASRSPLLKIGLDEKTVFFTIIRNVFDLNGAKI